MRFIHTHTNSHTQSLTHSPTLFLSRSRSSFTWHGCLSNNVNNVKCKHFEICRFAGTFGLCFHFFASLCLCSCPERVCIINVSHSTPPVNLGELIEVCLFGFQLFLLMFDLLVFFHSLFLSFSRGAFFCRDSCDSENRCDTQKSNVCLAVTNPISYKPVCEYIFRTKNHH